MSVLFSEGLLTALGAVGLLAGTVLAAWGLARQGGPPAGAARWCIGTAGYLVLLALVARGLQVRGLPLSSAYEAGLLTVAATALLYPLAVPRRLAALGGVCSGASALVLLALVLLLTPAGVRAPQSPPAALLGVWFPLHVGVTTLGYGGVILGGTAGLVRLLRGGTAADRFRPAVLSGTDLDALARRGLAWGYPLLTLGMTLGAVWGWTTWGRYWSWSIKEVLALLVWVLFTVAMHTRRLKGWNGRVHSAVLAAGLVAVGMTLLAAEALVRWLTVGVRYVF